LAYIASSIETLVSVVIGDGEREVVFFWSALVGGELFVAIPLWLIWKRQFADQGPMLALLQHAARQGFQWTRLTTSLCRSAVCGVCACVPLLASNVMVFASQSDAKRLWHSRFKLLGSLAQCLCLVWFIGHVWLVRLACHLHQFDMLCYTQALSSAMELTVPIIDCATALTKIEGHITTRLMYSSKTWVRTVLLCTVFLVLTAGMSTLILFSSPNLGTEAISLLSGLATVSSLTAIALTHSLASLNLFFHERVLRHLNTPVLLHTAQRLFGQQMLNHLKELDWGFKFGRSTICFDSAQKVVFALTITAATSVSKVITARTVPALTS